MGANGKALERECVMTLVEGWMISLGDKDSKKEGDKGTGLRLKSIKMKKMIRKFKENCLTL